MLKKKDKGDRSFHSWSENLEGHADLKSRLAASKQSCTPQSNCLKIIGNKCCVSNMSKCSFVIVLIAHFGLEIFLSVL